MKVTLRAAGPPPIRTDSLRCADRHSPDAASIAEAGLAEVARRPSDFPIKGTVGVTVRYAAEPPELEGYDTTTAIEEVLVDVGVLQDERQVDWERPIVDPALGDGFEVTVETVRPSWLPPPDVPDPGI
jgi:hypothetical protein